jgi:hypothetical protein
MRECEHHTRTVAAGRGAEADAHASGCERCRETLLVARALERLARSASQAPPPAVDARSLFRKSQFVARLLGEQRTAERAAQPLAFVQVVALAALAGAIGWTLMGGAAASAVAGRPPRSRAWRPGRWPWARSRPSPRPDSCGWRISRCVPCGRS